MNKVEKHRDHAEHFSENDSELEKLVLENYFSRSMLDLSAALDYAKSQIRAMLVLNSGLAVTGLSLLFASKKLDILDQVPSFLILLSFCLSFIGGLLAGYAAGAKEKAHYYNFLKWERRSMMLLERFGFNLEKVVEPGSRFLLEKDEIHYSKDIWSENENADLLKSLRSRFWWRQEYMAAGIFQKRYRVAITLSLLLGAFGLIFFVFSFK